MGGRWGSRDMEEVVCGVGGLVLGDVFVLGCFADRSTNVGG